MHSSTRPFGRTVAALAIAGALAFSLAGCSKSSSTTAPDGTSGGSTSGGDVLASFTVAPGLNTNYQVNSLPATLTFNVVGIENEPDNQPIAFFYDAKAYTGGQTDGRGFNGEMRSQKLKVYAANGPLMGNESKKYGVNWKGSSTYKVKLEFTAGYVRLFVNDVQVEQKDGLVSSVFTLGIGWPPKIRSGFAGAVYTDVHWPIGSTKIN
jgi:hypothetical protein